jgi:hypothetical protein
MPKLPPAVAAIAVAILFFLLLPTLVIVPAAFSDSVFLSFPPKSFSLRWFEAFFSSESWLLAAARSVRVALLVSVIATSIATICALALLKCSPAINRIAEVIFMAPMALPVIVYAVSVYGLRECLAMVPQRRFRSDDVLAVLADLFVEYGPPEHVRSDNGLEFAAKAVRAWLGKVGVNTLFIEPGSPWENGYVESFNARLRDELLNGEIFYTLDEVRIVTGWWRDHYNKLRPRSVLGYRPPAPETTMPS